MGKDNMTLDAVSRRGFLRGATALTFMIGAGGIAAIQSPGDATAAPTVPDALEANGWIRIGTDGRISLLFPITEMGQGSSTALPVILAEELDADWSMVDVEQLNKDDRDFGNPIFGNVLYTAGSTGVYGYFDTLRTAGAQARALLMAMAARHWDVPVTQVTTEPNLVIHAASGRRLSYGDIATLPSDGLAIPDISPDDFKPRDAYRLIGHAVPRIDIPAKSSGQATYAFDVQVPNMLYAVVLRAPVEGETALSIDDAETLASPGVKQTVILPDGIAVVADSIEAALAGRDRLEVTWSETSPARAFDSDRSLEDYSRAAEDLSQTGAPWRQDGDAAATIDAATSSLQATYRSDYAYHAQIEPMAATASVDADGKGAEVWVGSQTQSWSTRTVTEVLGTTPDRVRLNMMTMGGSFGRRTAVMQEYLRDALLASKAAGVPVKVVWDREDDLKNGVFRPAAAQTLRAGLDAEGHLQGWHHRVAAPSVIAFFNPIRWAQVEPNDIITMRGSENKFYQLPDMLAEHVVTERAARLAPWRGIGAAYTSYAAEAFMDELAHTAGQDPIAFRKGLLTHNPRGQRLLDRVAEQSGWGRPAGNTALGVAFAGYGDTMAAGVAEISVDRDSGEIRVHRFWASIDAGLVVSPDNGHAQVEGGIAFGVSSALKERITIKNGEVEQSNYWDYEILRANEMPEIEITLETVAAPPTGLGEAGTPMVAPAIANAFFALTGRRLRHMPFTPDRVLEALA